MSVRINNKLIAKIFGLVYLKVLSGENVSEGLLFTALVFNRKGISCHNLK